MYPGICNPPRYPTREREKMLAHESHFRCLHCGALVYTQPAISGVQNRNHCPFCLWSRHVDYLRPGDRMSACKAVMQPIALAVKRTRNRYASSAPGELMLVHRCNDCSKLSINRIAADDQAGVIVHIFHTSLSLDMLVRADLELAHINPLDMEDKAMLFTQLYGISN